MEIRLGTIGSNFIVHNILRHVVKTPGFTYTAAYSRSEEKAEALANQYGAARFYTDMDAFLADEEMNFVYIATPNVLHYEHARAALLAGKHVLLEKPFCPEVSLAKELKEIAREKGLLLVDMVPTAFLPNLPVLKEQLKKIGHIRMVMGNYTQYSSRYDRFRSGETDNVFNPVFSGGSLMDINYYNIFLNAFLFGRPEKVAYHANLWDGIDTSGILTLRYRDFVSTNAGAKDTWGENFFLIEGENGNIRVIDGTDSIPEVELVTRERTERFNRQSEELRMDYEVEYFVRALREGIPADVYERLEITADAVWIAEQARKSGEVHFPGDEK